MKPLLKYVGALLLLFCLLTASAASAAVPAQAGEEVYELVAVFIGADMSDELNDSMILIVTDFGEATLRVTEESRFFVTPDEPVSFAQFVERFMDAHVRLEFVVYQDEYYVVNCTWVPLM